MNYELSDAEYAANEVEDTWVQGLLAGLGAYLNTLQPLLTPANFEQLVSLLLEKVKICQLTSAQFSHTGTQLDCFDQQTCTYVRCGLTCVLDRWLMPTPHCEPRTKSILPACIFANQGSDVYQQAMHTMSAAVAIRHLLSMLRLVKQTFAQGSVHILPNTNQRSV